MIKPVVKMLTAIFYEANRIDSDQAAPIGAAWSESVLFAMAWTSNIYLSGKGLNGLPQ